ncbi:HlyD family secretion protein [Empedobacter falsenii]|uniref:HlyD family secretion protein n=1 Tax=Empedobacter falsenii TaxID=343874 RepID=UPI001C59FD3C|nr:efflux RND transporter periplasmic adaptor subunit [Empedobacter falsenii]MBW1619764.1 HlyD family efflux transporter periplasmic adaptor subunit [Empedobacter falsenii]
MYKIKTIALVAGIATMLTACNDNKVSFDASGSFEAEETIISSEATGTIEQFSIEEGQTLEAGQTIGYIDSLQLYLKKKQLEAQTVAVLGKKPNIPVQLSALQEQLRTAQSEQTRITNLVKGDAATPKQLDDINAQIEVLKKQIEAQKSTLSISSEGLSKDIVPLQVQIEQLNDQLAKCNIINPTNGTVLAKYAEANEMTATGKPLYKIADLSNIILRAYITGNQLPQVKLNQQVKVLTDDGKGGYKETTGTIVWINDKAEFTPKTIQTKDERANMVYAIKVKVKNDGAYKVGMYGEIKFK